jgi:hypothetical protein
MTCSVNHETITTKFCSICGAPKGSAAPVAPPVAPQWNAPVAQPAVPQWNTPAQQYVPPQNFQQPQYGQPYPQQPAWGAQPLPGYAFPLASRGKRFGAYALDFLFSLLSLLFCGIPYFIWALIVWKDGQTPGKQALKMRTYGTVLARPANWGHMAIRNFLIPVTVSIAYVPFYISLLSYDSYYGYGSPYDIWYWIGNFVLLAFYVTSLVMFLNSSTNQTLQDKLAKTVVLDESYRY